MMVTHLQPLAEGDLKLLKPIVASITVHPVLLQPAHWPAAFFWAGALSG